MVDKIYALDEVPEGFVPKEPRTGNQHQDFARGLLNIPMVGQGLAQAYNLLPSLSEPAPVSYSDKLIAEGLSSNPEDRAKYYKSRDYEGVGIDPETEKETVGGVRGDKHPFSAPSISEFVAEFITNADSLGTAAATALGGPLAGIAAATGIGAAREGTKTAVIPDSEVDYLGTGMEIAAESLPLVGKGGKAIAEARGPIVDAVKPYTSPIVDAVTNKVLNTKPVKYMRGVAENVSEQAADAYQKYSGPLYDKLDETAKNFYKRFDDTFGVAGDLRNLGITDDAFNAFNTVSITDNYSRLIDGNDAFKKIAYTGGPTVRGDLMYDLFDETGEKVANYYKGTDVQVPLSSIFDTKSYAELTEGIYSAAGRDGVEDLLSVKDDYLRNIYDVVAKRKLLNDPSTAARAAEAGVSVPEYVFKNTPDTRNIASEEILEVLQGETIGLEDLWELRKTADAMAGWTATGRWFGDGKEKNPLTSMVYRKLAGSMRDVLSSNVDDPEVIKAIADYSDMAPIVNAVAQKAAASMGKVFRPNDIYVSAIGGNLYRGLGYAGKILKSPAAKGYTGKALEKLQGALTVEGLEAGAKEVVDPSAASQFISSMKRQGAVEGLTQKRVSDENLATTPPQESEALQGIFNMLDGGQEQSFTPQENQLLAGGEQGGAGDVYQDPTSLLGLIPETKPTPIPRDPEAIASRPEDVALIENAVTPTTAAMFRDAMGSDNPLKRRVATIAVMQEAPELFEESMYGLRSLISEGDRYVIGDPGEAQFYRQTIKHLKGIGSIGENFYTMQLSALNDPTDMTVYPRPDVVQRQPRPQDTQPQESALERLTGTISDNLSSNY